MFSLYVAIKIARPESLIYFPDLESKQPIYLFVRLTGSVSHVRLFYIENEWLAKHPVGSYEYYTYIRVGRKRITFHFTYR